MELLNGVSAAEAARVERLRPSIWILEIDTGVWSLGRRMIRDARRAAITAPLPDLIIAACARSYDVDVLHHSDTHFDLLRTLKTE
jgi:predicted nucleic acid-binding protein